MKSTFHQIPVTKILSPKKGRELTDFPCPAAGTSEGKVDWLFWDEDQTADHAGTKNSSRNRKNDKGRLDKGSSRDTPRKVRALSQGSRYSDSIVFRSQGVRSHLTRVPSHGTRRFLNKLKTSNEKPNRAAVPKLQLDQARGHRCQQRAESAEQARHPRHNADTRSINKNGKNTSASIPSKTKQNCQTLARIARKTRHFPDLWNNGEGLSYRFATTFRRRAISP